MAEQQKPGGTTGKTYTKREAEVADVELVTPHGSKVTVPKRRADALLSRDPLELPGGKRKGYTLTSDVKSTPKPENTGGGAR